MSGGAPLWDAGASYERVALEDLAVELRVGLSDWERTPGKAQRLLVTVEMFRHRGAFAGSSLADCIDYGRVYRHVIERWTPARAHVDLLEQLLEELVAVCFEDARVEACRIAIRKPHVYNARAVPLVEVYRLRSDVSSGRPHSRQVAPPRADVRPPARPPTSRPAAPRTVVDRLRSDAASGRTRSRGR
jgi:7,8-dihydroneopterin aldolase/epimerase/oxygenase